MERIPIGESTRLLVLTGAGVSAESGIPTFRDAGGLWEGHAVEDVASPEGFARDPATVWRFYSQRRRGLASVAPNEAHRALVRAEERLGDRFLLVTQNVDGLHRAAGSKRVIEMHGGLARTRCQQCPRPAFADSRAYADGEVPLCDQCGGQLRPDIVWFGEPIPPDALRAIDVFLGRTLWQAFAQHRAEKAGAAAPRGEDIVFLAAGTSGLVYPAAGIVHQVRELGGATYLANMDAPANASAFQHVALGPASKVLPALLD
jgi:NAD-dependent deacetylase